MWALLCCLECRFLSREGAWKEGREHTCPSCNFTPTSSLTTILAHNLWLHHMLPFPPYDPSFFLQHIHQHNLTNLAQELMPVWGKCLHPLMSPRASSVIPSDIFCPGLSWGHSATEVFHFHSLTSPTLLSFSQTETPISL